MVEISDKDSLTRSAYNTIIRLFIRYMSSLINFSSESKLVVNEKNFVHNISAISEQMTPKMSSSQ